MPTSFQIYGTKKLNVFLTVGSWRAGARSMMSISPIGLYVQQRLNEGLSRE